MIANNLNKNLQGDRLHARNDSIFNLKEKDNKGIIGANFYEQNRNKSTTNMN